MISPVPAPLALGLRYGLLYLAPVCVFGFLFCPYLDLTFLRARAATNPNAGIAAFTLGFGVFFVAMILFTFWYARFIQPGHPALSRILAWLIAGHMMLQSAFTLAVHSRALSEDRRAVQPLIRIVFAALLLLAFFIGVLSSYDSLRGETVYRLFMAFYGLIFPTYVWLCVIPTRAGNGQPSTRKLGVLLLSVLIAAPMFWLGFIDNRMVWLVPGLAVVIAARGALRLAIPAVD